MACIPCKLTDYSYSQLLFNLLKSRDATGVAWYNLHHDTYLLMQNTIFIQCDTIHRIILCGYMWDLRKFQFGDIYFTMCVVFLHKIGKVENIV